MTVGRKAQYDGEIRSLFSGIPIAATLINQPMRMSRSNYLVNNINHINDQRSQVVINWSDNAASGRGLTTSFDAATGGDPTGLILSTTYQARLDPNGVPYPLRIFVAGYSTDGTPCSIRVRVAGSVISTATTAGFTGVTPDWRDLGGGSILYKMFLFNAPVSTAIIQVPSEIGSSAPSQALVTLITIRIEDPSSPRYSLPKLVVSGVYAAEYVGGY